MSEIVETIFVQEHDILQSVIVKRVCLCMYSFNMRNYSLYSEVLTCTVEDLLHNSYCNFGVCNRPVNHNQCCFTENMFKKAKTMVCELKLDLLYVSAVQ